MACKNYLWHNKGGQIKLAPCSSKYVSLFDSVAFKSRLCNNARNTHRT